MTTYDEFAAANAETRLYKLAARCGRKGGDWGDDYWFARDCGYASAMREGERLLLAERAALPDEVAPDPGACDACGVNDWQPMPGGVLRCMECKREVRDDT